MDLEELNKTQVILLTLLVSFVTSIATGIVTVALMSQTPPAVTQTINRVVERTVERVVPAAVTDSGVKSAPTVEKETTVVVKEDDLITESISKNKQFIVRLVTADTSAGTEDATGTSADGTSSTTPSIDYTFEGMGVVVSGDGIIATAASVGETSGLIAMTADGTSYKTTLISSDDSIALLKLVSDTESGSVSLKAAAFADTGNLKLGQTVIALGGEGRTSVGIGIISGLIPGSSTTTPSLSGIETNIDNTTLGGPLVNIFGEVVGVRGDEPKSKNTFTSGDVVKASIAAMIKKSSTDTVGANAATSSAQTVGG